MPSLLESVKKDFAHIDFTSGDHFVWQPRSNRISYVEDAVLESDGSWSLMHELGHATLEHHSYRDDLQLLMMEVQAWDKAKELAIKYDIEIAEEHIEKCLESYRGWLHKRSRCIDCKTNSLQLDVVTYQCHNCGTKWMVPESKLCKVRKKRL